MTCSCSPSSPIYLRRLLPIIPALGVLPRTSVSVRAHPRPEMFVTSSSPLQSPLIFQSPGPLSPLKPSTL